MEDEGTHLHRYTNLASTIDVLTKRQFTLSPYEHWVDKNDVACLDEYASRKKLKTVRALCFTGTPETSHHWTCFAGGTDGVRLELSRDQVFSAAEATPGFRIGSVAYPPIPWLRDNGASTEQLPFLKRYPYRGEAEVRLLYESPTAMHEPITLEIPQSAILRVAISAQLHSELANKVISHLRSLIRPHKLDMIHTTLHGNKRWMTALKKEGLRDYQDEETVVGPSRTK